MTHWLALFAQVEMTGWWSELIKAAPSLFAMIVVVHLCLKRMKEMDDARDAREKLVNAVFQQINAENNVVCERMANKADKTFETVAKALETNSQSIAVNSEVLRRLNIEAPQEPGRQTLHGPSGMMAGGL